MRRFRETAVEEGSEGAVDISPLMDCVFILLIFFIVTTAFVDESGVEVDKPQPGGSSRSDEKTSILIDVTRQGEVSYEGSRIPLGGVRTLVKNMLSNRDMPVIIQADSAVQSGLLVRVIDEAKLGGATKVSVATRREKG